MLRLADMTWKDVETYLGTSRGLIVPVGTCEQHGLHLPLSTDTLIAEAFAVAVSGATGVAVAPTLVYGVNLPCDRFVPGTAGLTFDSLRECIGDLLEDWERQGFRQFFLLTAHGCAMDDYSFAHHEALKQGALPFLEGAPCDDSCGCDDGCGCDEHAITVSILFPYWTKIGDILTAQDGVEHACEAETSLMLHLHPELVRIAEAADGPPDGERGFDAFPEGVAHCPPPPGWNGAEGSPTAATAEKGRGIFERCLGPMVAHVAKRTATHRS
jgi:creatinine amidohydrolase